MKEPRYREIADKLRIDIGRGDYSRTDEFPTERLLCKRFNASRFTIREALRILTAEGLITRKRGSGTVVRRSEPHIGLLQQLPEKVNLSTQNPPKSTLHFKKMHFQQIPRNITDRIGRKMKRKWFVFHGKKLESGRTCPVSITCAWINPSLMHIIEQINVDGASLYSQIEIIGGISISRFTQDIQAIAASENLAKELGLQPGDPILRIIRCYFDENDRLLEVSSSHHSGNLYTYSMNIVAS